MGLFCARWRIGRRFGMITSLWSWALMGGSISRFCCHAESIPMRIRLYLQLAMCELANSHVLSVRFSYYEGHRLTLLLV